MRLSDEKFYNEKLDLTIPEMKKACELFNAGDINGAEKAFADYIKVTLDSAKWFENHEIKIAEGTMGHSDAEFADMVVDGYITAVGFLYKCPDGIIDWEYNPTYNKYCEYTYHLCYHGMAQALAKAYQNTKDKKYAERMMYVISSWIDQCECPEVGSGDGRPGVWRTLEAGGRMSASWPDIIHAFLDCDAVTDAFWVKLFKSVWEHSQRLINSKTHYNWHTTEMSGLVTMGILYGFFKESDAWIEYAISSLVDQINTEFYPDGMQLELATGYHGGVIGNFNTIGDKLRRYGREIPTEFKNGIELMYTMYTQLVMPDGRCPGLNDAGTFSIKNHMVRASGLYPENDTFRFFATDGKEGKAPEYVSRVLPYSGFTVMRTDWTEDAMWALMDVGPEGTQHVHEDKLNFIMYAYNTYMLPDIGFYAYDTSDMRKFSITTVSHNTGMVDGKGQNRMKTHRWGLIENDTVSDFCYKNSEEYEVSAASYDQGYGDELTDVTHNRKAVFFKKGFAGSRPFYLILDEFISGDDNEHDFEVSFQLPDVPVSAFSHSVEAKYKNGAELKMVSDKYPNIHIGQYAPQYRGWRPIHSPEEHEHAPAPAVTYIKRGKSARFATVLYPSPDSNIPEISVELTGNGVKLAFGDESKEFAYDCGEFKAEKYTL